MTPRLPAVLAAGLLAGAVWPVVGPSARAQGEGTDPLISFERRLDNLQRSVDRLDNRYREQRAVLRAHPVETRLIEARMHFDMGHWETAAVMLLELVDEPKLRGQPEHPEALLMLGRSLLELDNVRGAERYLRQAARTPDAEVADDARYFLMDTALDRGDDDALAELVRTLSQDGSPRTRYATGKALIRLGRYDRARSILQGLSTHEELGLRSRYYLGVALTALGRMEAAASEFVDLTTAAGGEGAAEVRDLARLALGRLKMEEGDLVGAVTAYQRVERHSAHYEVALHEMAWAYIKAEQYDKALGTLDALLLTVKDPDLDVQAHTLRGRLNIFLSDYDTAVESFEKIVGRFAPIRNELDRFTRDPANLHRYFEWLLERQVEGAGLHAPLTERTARWVESVGDMEHVVEVFDAMSAQRNELDQTLRIAEDLERVVSSDNRVELFPQLQEGWSRAVVVENQLLFLSSQMLDFQNDAVQSGLRLGEQEELAELVRWRKKLERRFSRMPMTFGQYQARKAQVDERFLDLKRQAFLVGQRLQEVRRQLLALERYVDERQYAEHGEKFSEAREQEIRALLGEEKARLEGIYEQLATLKRELEVEARRVGAGDEATRGEEDLKQALIAAHKREGLFYDRHAQERGGGFAQRFESVGEARDRIWEHVSTLEAVVAAIEREVDQEVRSLRALIATESDRLRGYDETMVSYERDSRRIGERVGAELFDRAREKMKDVVLKAEVGLIDVAWQKKRNKTDEIQEVNRERSDKLQRLDGTLRELMTDRIAPSKPASEDQEDEGDGGDDEEGGP